MPTLNAQGQISRRGRRRPAWAGARDTNSAFAPDSRAVMVIAVFMGGTLQAEPSIATQKARVTELSQLGQCR
ncbi:hypothetical protein AA0522_0603 [Gluconacetobacter liquefaciens NRIC 0522]|uniref:hypothetical protein n=1 Tax=Gluconacetobacter liquefaciens TaxID=89584 RepID=UPI0011C05A6D|nr:hypothetical protein [Gluconacetobacter liquefaciens]GBQ95493.1 hypothetical protein AA0522_0603 [Gluconacetobacter liquefaciens NRIC 0522]